MSALPVGKGEVRRTTSRRTNRIAILAFGSMLKPALAAAEELDATVANMRFVKPLDVDLVSRLALEHDSLVTIEENVVAGGAGSAVGRGARGAGHPRSRSCNWVCPTLSSTMAIPRNSSRSADSTCAASSRRSTRGSDRAGRTRSRSRRRSQRACAPCVPSRSSASPVPKGPAYFADWLDARAIAWQLIALDEGAAVPADPRAFAGIGLMGGPMSVNDGLPWSAPLSALLRAAVDRDDSGDRSLPRRTVAGAGAGRAGHARAGRRDRLGRRRRLRSLRPGRNGSAAGTAFTTFQWHYDAFALPAGAVPVLTNAFNANQAFVVGGRHIGFQCHVEMTRES